MAKRSAAVLAVALSIIASVLGAYHLSAATIITGTDPSGDVFVVSFGSPIPAELVNAADLVSVTITFTDSSLTAEFVVIGDLPSDLMNLNYSVYFIASIVGTYNGRYAQLVMGVGNVLGYSFYGPSFAIVEDIQGNVLVVYFGNSTTFTVQGNKVIFSAPIGTSSFSPSLGNSTDYYSMVMTGIIGPGGSVAAYDELNLYESGSISSGETTTTTATTTSPTQTTTTTTATQPPEYEDDPLKQTPTTGDVTVSLAPPTSSRVTVDPTTGFVEVDIRGTGSTSGAAPDHVGIGIVTYFKDGNFTYEIFNGDGVWDADNDPSNGYVFSMSYMGSTINLEVKPTGPPDNPWATFSYQFYGRVPGSAIAVFSEIQRIDRAYVYARAYLDRDEARWNQAYTDLPLNTGVGQVTTTTTPNTGGGVGTTTTTTPAGGTGEPGEAPASGGLNPMIIVGAVAAVAVIGAAVFMLRRK